MKKSILIALAILPCLAFAAEARGSRHHHGYRHFGTHHHRSFHHRYFGWGHRHYHHRFRHHAWGGESRHDRAATVPEGRSAIYAMVTRSAIEHGLPPALAHGIVRVESGYNCSAYHAGAAGIMQVKAATARSVGITGGLRSCSTGLEAGMRYLRQAYDAAHGNSAYAATLYNRGLGARPSNSGYARSVRRMSAL